MWSLTRPDAPSDEPVLIVGDRVTGASPEVLATGVSLGMARREAEALAPFATVLVRDVEEEARRFDTVVDLLEGLIPRVEVVAPGLVFVPIAGAVNYYGGEEVLADRVAEEVDNATGHQRGGEALIGIANGPFAARWAAVTATVGEPLIVADTIEFLSRLDLSTLRESVGGEELINIFRWLGISTLGDLIRLPREILASRFGNQGLLAHRLASGEDRFVNPREIPSDLSIEASFEDPLETLEAVAFAGGALAERLLKKLRLAGMAPHQVTILAEAAHGPARERVWRSADPFTERSLSERVWWQLRAWVEAGGVPGGIVRLRIEPGDPLRCGQTTRPSPGRVVSYRNRTGAGPCSGLRRARECSPGESTRRADASRAGCLVALGGTGDICGQRPRGSLAGGDSFTQPSFGAATP